MSILDHPTYRPIRWCAKCDRMVSKWHQHWPTPQGKLPPVALPELATGPYALISVKP